MKRYLLLFSVLLGLSANAADIDFRALGTNGFFTNGLIVNSKYWTNQSGLYRYQPGTGPVVNGSPGPAFTLRNDGSAFVGTNVFQDVTPTATGIYFPHVISMSDSNEASIVHADWFAIDNANYGVYGGASLSAQQAGSGVFTVSGDSGPSDTYIQLNATPAGASSIILNHDGSNRFVASSSDTNVVMANSVGQNWQFIGQTNGEPTTWVRADGSMLQGKNVTQDINVGDYSKLWSPYALTMTASNEPNRIVSAWTVIPDESYDFYAYSQISVTGDKDNSVGYFELQAENTNGTSAEFLMTAEAGGAGTGLRFKTNNVIVWHINSEGDMDVIKKLAYSWPSAHGSATSVLTDTDGAGTLDWVVPSGGGGSSNSVAVAAGTNITAVTNSGLVTVSVTDLTNTIRAVSSIGPGTLNFLPVFINPTNISDSRVVQRATNMLSYNIRTNWGVNTNSWTNEFYGQWTDTNNWQKLSLISQAPGQNLYNEITSERGSGDTRAMNKLLLQKSWMINGLGSGSAPDAAGDLLPLVNDAINIGNTSLKVHDIAIGRVIIGTPRDDTVIYSDGYQGHGFGISTAGSLYFTGPGLSGIQFNQSGLLGAALLDVNQYGVGFGSTVSNVQASLRYGGLAGFVSTGTNSSVAAPTAVANGASPASGTDKGGPDFLLIGGQSTGTGTNGNVRIQTAEKALSTSATKNTGLKDRMFVIADPIILTTNSATIVFNATIPTALRGFGGTVIAHTEIENGVDIATVDEEFVISANRKGSTVVAGTPSAPITATSTSGGSAAIANTWTLVANAQSVDLKLICVTSGILSTNSTVRVTFIPNSSAVPIITHP